MKRILLVDDDEGLAGPLGAYLKRRGAELELLTADGGRAAIAILETEEVDLVLSDLHMPDGDGVDLLAYLLEHHPSLPVVVMSGHIGKRDVDTLARYGCLTCLRKPVTPSRVFEAVTASLAPGRAACRQACVSLAGVLHLVEIEEKTCLVEVDRGPGPPASFFFVRGKVQRTVCGPLRGEDAAVEMLTWERPAIGVKTLNHMKDAQLGPEQRVTEVILRAMEIAAPGGPGVDRQETRPDPAALPGA